MQLVKNVPYSVTKRVLQCNNDKLERKPLGTIRFSTQTASEVCVLSLYCFKTSIVFFLTQRIVCGTAQLKLVRMESLWMLQDVCCLIGLLNKRHRLHKDVPWGVGDCGHSTVILIYRSNNYVMNCGPVFVCSWVQEPNTATKHLHPFLLCRTFCRIFATCLLSSRAIIMPSELISKTGGAPAEKSTIILELRENNSCCAALSFTCALKHLMSIGWTNMQIVRLEIHWWVCSRLRTWS